MDKKITKECPNCLSIFAPYRKQIFCSLRCKDAYSHKVKRRLKEAKNSKEYHRLWQKYCRYHMPIEGFSEKSCPGCESLFIPKTRTQIYCCKKCGNSARRHDPERQNTYRQHQIDYANRSVEHFIGRLLNKKSRNRHLRKEYVMGIYDAQRGKCALSGIQMTHITGHGRVATNISIDRIDSDKGYIEGNIQLVCHAVNIAKNSWSQDVFIDFCRKIVEKADKED